jgi:cysteine desulfurase
MTMTVKDMTYLDWAASAPPELQAVNEARDVSQEFFANPSSVHAAGRRAQEKLAEARSRMAAALGVQPAELLFTSGGTESNTSLLLSLLDRHRLGGAERRKMRVVTTEIEHASVYEQARLLQGHGISCEFVRPRPDGTVDPEAIARAVDPHTLLVSVMLVNNETGAIQDIPAIARAVREASRGGRRVIVHTDAVQALGKVPFSLREMDVDAASFSGHKIGAPRGVGALYLRTGVSPGFLSVGGGQEGGRRPGTENLPGICAMAVAAELRRRTMEEDLREARRNAALLIEGLRRIPGAWTVPVTRDPEDAARWSPWVVSVVFPPLPAEVVVRTAEENGYCISTGAACSSKKKDRTRVPESMGLPPETARCAVRISLGPRTTREEVEGFLAAMSRALPPLLDISRGVPRGAERRE